LFPAALALAVVGFGMYFDHAASSVAAPQRAAATDRALAREDASLEVRRVAQWAVITEDTAGLPFVVVDNTQSRIFAFDPQGRPLGSATVRDGSVSAPGRFVADPIASARSGGIVWANAGAQVAVRSADEHAPMESAEGAAASLQVEPAFWTERLATLRAQPSIAYVLARAYTGRKPS
jgi:hypothetical protein